CGNASLRLRQIALLFAFLTSDSSSPAFQGRMTDLLSTNSMLSPRRKRTFLERRFICDLSRSSRRCAHLNIWAPKFWFAHTKYCKARIGLYDLIKPKLTIDGRKIKRQSSNQ